MSNNHIITREIGNLRGFSTDSIFLRPANVADVAVNIQRGPDGTLQIRRGYQCQIAKIGGMGIGTYDDPAIDVVHTVCVGMDGFVYNKLTKQIFLYYDGQVLGDIVNITNANPANVESPGHGLQTGAQVIIRDVDGMLPINNNTYTITVVDPNNFTLDGVDSILYPPYIPVSGYWSIEFADQRYLTFTIFTDPRFLSTNPGWSVAPWSISPWGSPGGESITCNITVNRAAQVSTPGVNTNTLNVKFGHELVATDTIKFTTASGTTQQRTVISVTSTSITFDGYPVTVLSGTYINQFFDIPFRRGFDVTSPYLIQTFLDTITNPTTGVHGLQASINGDSNLPAAFLQIIEPVIIGSSRFYSSLGWSIAPWSTSPWGSPSSPSINRYFEMDYWYWQRVNFTVSPPMPGSANPVYQNSKDFENASLEAFDDVIYIANGIDYPQKYDGQTVYRTGMPLGVRPSETDNTTYISQPFVANNTYQYATTYEQVDTRGHIVEGEISEVDNHEVMAANAAINVQVTNLTATFKNNWNTNGANATGASVTVYGPDRDGFYYDIVPVNSGFTLKIGDTAYYADTTSAVINAAELTPTIILPVNAGHAVLPGDFIYFIDATDVERLREVASVTDTTITIMNERVTVDPTDPIHANILSYRTGLVFADVAIINSNQANVNTIVVVVGHNIQLGDLVEFLDSNNNLQRRTVVGVSVNTVVVSGIPVTVGSGYLIYSLNQRTDSITIQRINPNAITFTNDSPISNNLRINIYRTLNNQQFGVNGELYFVASIPNDSSGGAFQTYIDGLPDQEVLQREFDDPDIAPNPPPISKYLKAFGNQLFYAGGERGNPDNSDNVFFSEGNAPETVPLASHSFSVPSKDDDITGIGVSGSTVVTTKKHSLWAATGNFLSGNIEVVQIAPGTNIGCIAHATIASVGPLMYFLHTNGVYAITENQLFPTDAFGNPVPISLAIDVLFRQTNFQPQTRYVFKRAVAVNYSKDNQYLLFLPCEDAQSSIRTANGYSIVLSYDYQEKNWFLWDNINAAGGMVVIDDDLYFQERRFSAVDGNTANLYKQHRFYRLIDHADHAGPQRMEWRSSWEDLSQPEVRKKFCRCVLLMDRLSELFQFNNPEMYFSTYLNRLPNLQNTIAKITQVDNIRNSSWSYSGWGWNFWSGYQDSFITVNLKQGTVAKSIQVGFSIKGINMDIRLAGFQLEIIPENRRSVLR